jgi:hypothetical protein
MYHDHQKRAVGEVTMSLQSCQANLNCSNTLVSQFWAAAQLSV